MIIVVMGVAGAGKTAVGLGLAAALDGTFYDADDFHSHGAIAKMANGTPLDDEDRAPWLDRLAALIASAAPGTGTRVLACSALRERYRARLRAAAVESHTDIRLVYLKVTPAIATQRIRDRTGHYMPERLVESQFATLEEPRDAIVVDAAQPMAVVIAQVVAEIRPLSA